MERKISIIIVMLFCVIFVAKGQETIKSKDKKASPFFMGGNVGLAFGDITLIEIAPHVGYYFLPRLSAGVGLKYHYYKENQRTYAGIKSGGYSSNIYGGKVFASYEILRDLGVYRKELRGTGFFLQTEYELLSMKDRMINASESSNKRVLSKNYFAGIGIRQWFGTYKSVYLLMLYNFNYNEEISPYDSNPIVRIGINF